MLKRIGTDDGEKKVIADVERFGWHCVNVFAEEGSPPWSYSIGFYESWQKPELIIVGLKREVAHGILNVAATAIAAGRDIDYAKPTEDLTEGYSCCFVEVPTRRYHERVGIARWFYGGNSFPLYQLVWPSRDGHFPWHPDAERALKEWQAVLGEAPSGV